MRLLQLREQNSGPELLNNKPKYYHWVGIGIIFLCLISLSFRWIMTERIPFIMDELVDIHRGCQVGKGFKIYSEVKWGIIPRTPLMTYLISAVTKLANNSFSTAILARKLMWFGTVIIFFLTYLIARQVNGSYTAVLAILLLCGFTTFLDRSIRIRADLISTLFSLPGLWAVVYPSLHPLFLGVAGFFLGLAILTTQKAVYFVVAFAVALVGRQIIIFGLNAQSFKKIGLNSLIAIAGFAVPTLSFLLWIHFSGRMEQFLDQCFFHAAKIGFVADTYRDTWKFLWQTVLRNPAIWCLGLAGIFILLFEGIQNKGNPLFSENKDETFGPRIALSLWTLSMFVLTLQHTVKFPYFYLNIAPSLAICASLLLGHFIFLVIKFKQRLNWTHIVSALLVSYLLLIVPFIHHKKNLKTDLIRVQSAIMDRVDSITDPEDAVFDGIGIAVTRRKGTPYSMTARWFDERRAGANYDVIESLKKSQPKVLIWNYRVKRLRKDERAFLDTHFILDWANVYVVGTTVSHKGPEPTKEKINLLSSSKYAILAKDRQKIRIDRKIPGSVEFLTAGIHDVVIIGENQKLQLKYYPAVIIPPPPPQKKINLFPSYSD
jgi:hypothetical protein